MYAERYNIKFHKLKWEIIVYCNKIENYTQSLLGAITK